MENNKRTQIKYQKTDFNNHLICQLPGIFKCCKCKKNNNMTNQTQSYCCHCIFCGTPNPIKNDSRK